MGQIDTKQEIKSARSNYVVKHNDLIQKSRYHLSLAEMKAANYIVSLIKPFDHERTYQFEILDFCRAVGIDANGRAYNDVKAVLQSLRDKSVWMELPDGSEATVAWLSKARTNKRSGKAVVTIDEDLAPYLFELCERRTQYELLSVLPMKSKYSVMLYELCRSWAGLHGHTYDIDELKRHLDIDVDNGQFERYPDFRRYVLEKAQSEINEFTDLTVYFEPIKKGRKVVKIRLHVKLKDAEDKWAAQVVANYELDQ